MDELVEISRMSGLKSYVVSSHGTLITDRTLQVLSKARTCLLSSVTVQVLGFVCLSVSASPPFWLTVCPNVCLAVSVTRVPVCIQVCLSLCLMTDG